jgi:hypothetical protein
MHPMMEDVEKFPHSMLWDFSWLIALQRAWGVSVLTTWNPSYPPKFSFQIGSCMEQERNVISVETWKGEEVNWRRWAILKLENLAYCWHQNVWYVEGQGP